MRAVTSPVQFHTPQTPRTTPTFSGHVATADSQVQPANVSRARLQRVLSAWARRDEVPNELSSRLHHLEVMLQQLNTDLERVRIDRFPLFCFYCKAGPILNDPMPTLALLCLCPTRRSRIRWFCSQRWPT